MTIDSAAPSALDFVIEVERLYASLLATQESDSAVEPGLGGKLLYAGELDASARAFLVAGNIAGAASLAATANASVQRQAIHDGVADFLVNSLDEALRILKNEIRKHETVAVCIAAAPLAIENEMRERGVVPDLLAPGFAGNPVLASERRRLAIPSKDLTQALLCWSVASTPARWLPKLDTSALGCLASGSEPLATSRWLRLAPRYLGRLAQGIRILRCSRKIADAFATQVQTAIRQGEIGVAVKIDFNGTAVS